MGTILKWHKQGRERCECISNAAAVWEVTSALYYKSGPNADKGKAGGGKTPKIFCRRRRHSSTAPIVWAICYLSTEIGKKCGCLLLYSQAEPGRELTQPSPSLLAEPCICICLNNSSYCSLFPRYLDLRVTQLALAAGQKAALQVHHWNSQKTVNKTYCRRYFVAE